MAATAPARAGKTWNRRYALLLLAVLPLLLPLGDGPDEANVYAKIEQTLEQEHASKADCERADRAYEKFRDHEMSLFDIADALPKHRFAGALLPRKTWLHWPIALAAAAGYFAFLLLAFPSGKTHPRELLLVGAFTATFGILLLLGIQFAAFYAPFTHSSGQLGVLLLLLKFIAFSYLAAMEGGNGFLPSLFGFTAGVGFCEELTKQIPLIWHYKRKATLDWRGACLWGLASGIGFGVSEGITYSSDFYNGNFSGGVYVVRFVSCVAIHAIWAAAAAIMVCRRQKTIQGDVAPLALIPPLIGILAVPMVLHGLYDTLLKKEHEHIAFACAVVSFGWLAYQVERAVAEERRIA
jgi:RsiW-degrading membrane proteinase PrsW (M82 family)